MRLRDYVDFFAFRHCQPVILRGDSFSLVRSASLEGTPVLIYQECSYCMPLDARGMREVRATSEAINGLRWSASRSGKNARAIKRRLQTPPVRCRGAFSGSDLGGAENIGIL